MDSEPKLEYQCDDFSPQPRLNATAALIAAAIDNLHPAAPHAAPREGEPETIYGMLDRYTAAVRDAALAEFNVGPEDTGGDPDIDRAYETVHRLRVAVAAYIASQQAALDAAGEDVARWRRVRPMLAAVLRCRNFEDVDGPEMYLQLGGNEWRCGVHGGYEDDLVTRAIDAARASHPEAE